MSRRDYDCKVCGFVPPSPMMAHDRYFCPTCDVWLSPACSCDPSHLEFDGKPCQFLGSPEKPSMCPDTRTWDAASHPRPLRPAPSFRSGRWLGRGTRRPSHSKCTAN